MKNQQHKFLKYSPKTIASLIPLLLLGTVVTSISIRSSLLVADLTGFNQSIDMNSGFDESNDDSIFNAGPMEVLDAWRRATAMDDATTPSDALDEALKAFEDKELVNSPND